MTASEKTEPKPFIKVVYFDEESASDYLDISAGGRSEVKNEQMRKRTASAQTKVQAKVAARLSWLPFIGASAEIGAGVDGSAVAQSYLSKTLSNTILTDYLDEAAEDAQITKLREVAITAAPDSFAYMKMFTPFMVAARTADAGFDLAALDDALAQAKGYYELIATSTQTQERRVLRFNIRAFRNNYGLADLVKMNLAFHGVAVGEVRESDLIASNEMGVSPAAKTSSGVGLLAEDETDVQKSGALLEVFDVLLAGIER